MIVINTSVIYALLDEADQCHGQAVDWYQGVTDELVTTPLVLAESDHLAATRGGPIALRAFRADVKAGAYAVEWWPSAASEAVDVAEKYATLGMGLTRASLVCLAARLGCVDLATFDERHFRAIKPLVGGPAFRLLPADPRP